MKLRPSTAGLALGEVMFSTIIFAAVSLGLILGFIALERNYAATTDFGTNHADEMRISDYLALDLRRALAVQAARNNTTIWIPKYYGDDGLPQTPSLDGEGNVFYGTEGDSLAVHYYLSGGTIFRQSGAATPIPLALNVQDFIFDVTDAGKVVSTRITFNPTFRAGPASADATAATAFYNTTLLRNARSDVNVSVY
jgi:hypothetical protein